MLAVYLFISQSSVNFVIIVIVIILESTENAIFVRGLEKHASVELVCLGMQFCVYKWSVDTG